MAYEGFITKSLYGRQCALQQMSTSATGSARTGSNPTFLVGSEDIRKASTTNDTTSQNLAAFGQSFLQGSSAGSSSVFTLDPPIPGVHKFLAFGVQSPIYVKTANAEVFNTSAGSSFTTIKASSLGGCIDLVGITTAMWGAPDALAFTMTTTT